MEGNTSHPNRGVMKESGDNVKSWIRWGISWFPTLRIVISGHQLLFGESGNKWGVWRLPDCFTNVVK